MEGFKQHTTLLSPNIHTNLSIKKTLEIIAASLSSTQNFISKLPKIQSSSQDKSSNSFTKM